MNRRVTTIAALSLLGIGATALAEDSRHENFVRFESSPRIGVISIENRLPAEHLPVTLDLTKVSPTDRTKLRTLGYYSIQKTKGKQTCTLGTDVYSFFISHHPSRERGECAAAEFWSLWLETPQRHQLVYTVDGDVCFPRQPLLKSMRVQSTTQGPSVNVCSSDDFDAPIVCRDVPLPTKGG